MGNNSLAQHKNGVALRGGKTALLAAQVSRESNNDNDETGEIPTLQDLELRGRERNARPISERGKQTT
jgi:hypothetical protein